MEDVARPSSPQPVTASHSAPHADTGELRHTLSVHDVGAALVSAGVPRSHRQIIRYCETAMLDAVKVPGPTGAQWYISPASLPKVIGDLKQWEAQRARQGSWSGFYIGAHIGGANVDTSVTSGVPGVGFFDNNAFDKFSVDDTNVFAGGTLGYNLQLGQLVIGAEGDLGFINADASAIAPDVNDGDRVRAKYGFYSVIAGRLGFTPTERILIYGKAGVAFAKIQNTGADIDAGGVFDPNFSYVVSDTRTGWAFGGGIEAALHAGWSMKVEYLRMDFEDFTARDAGGRTYHVENSADTVKIGLNYKFGRDAPMPLK